MTPINSHEALRRLRAAHDALGTEDGEGTATHAVMMAARTALIALMSAYELTGEGSAQPKPEPRPISPDPPPG